MVISNFNHNFGFVAEKIFEQGTLENLDRCFDSFKKIVLWLRCQLS